MTRFEGVFRTNKPVIGMVHHGALPGAPLHDNATGINGLIDAARSDLAAFCSAGFDAVMFGNENDRPSLRSTWWFVPMAGSWCQCCGNAARCNRVRACRSRRNRGRSWSSTAKRGCACAERFTAAPARSKPTRKMDFRYSSNGGLPC